MSIEKPDQPLQSWNAERYAKNARFVSDLGSPVLELLSPQPGERILDLGCGDGALTRRLVEAGATVVGVDASPDLVAAAKALGIDARLMNGQELTFAREFDAVFTNAALHWMPNAAAVARGVAASLKPGGRFVGEFGGHGNVAAICTAVNASLLLHGFPAAGVPWYFPNPDEYEQVLRRHGFDVESTELIPRPTLLPTGMRGWLATFAHPLLKDIPGEQRNCVLDRAVELLKPSLCDRSGQWTADYVRLRFKALATNLNHDGEQQ